MNLCIDIGNTRTKLAVFDQDGSLIKLIIRDQFTSGKLDKVLKKYEIQHAIVSSVKKKQGKYKRMMGNKVKTFIELSHETPIPIHNMYQTPETLGNDRLAGVVGAAAIFPGNDILVVDAGTCIKYDFIDAEGRYYGGSICGPSRERLTCQVMSYQPLEGRRSRGSDSSPAGRACAPRDTR